MMIMVVMMLMGLGTAFTIGMRASMHGSACHSCKNAEGEELLQDN
jgi:F0F1-type ATP synthase assembly protein I